MKRECVGHSKMKRLQVYLDLPLWQCMGLLESLWHLAARECPRGDIGRLQDEDIAIGMEYRGDFSAMIDSLVRAKWLDVDDTHRLMVHDWHEHADDAVHMKLARMCETFASGVLPRISRIGGRERAELLEKWGQKLGLGGPVDPHCFDGRTHIDSVRTEQGDWAHYQSPAPPEPRQSPAPPEKQHHPEPDQLSETHADDDVAGDVFSPYGELTGKRLTKADRAAVSAFLLQHPDTDLGAVKAGIAATLVRSDQPAITSVRYFFPEIERVLKEIPSPESRRGYGDHCEKHLRRKRANGGGP